MNPKEKLRDYILNHFLFEVELKPILEADDTDLGELYDQGEITSDDFYEIMKEFKSVLLAHERKESIR